MQQELGFLFSCTSSPSDLVVETYVNWLAALGSFKAQEFVVEYLN